MPDYPFVYGANAPRPVQPGGTRVRVLRRGTRAEEEPGQTEREEGGDPWGTLLDRAVEELNASFQQAGAPFTCALHEDADGFVLHVRRLDGEGAAEDVEEELLEPRDLPAWLRRIRTGLGLIVDESA